MSARPKRRAVQRKNAVPAATHYVGYVEDDETPEMIMKKFEELERIKGAAASTKRTRDPASTGVSTPEDPGPSTANQSPAATDNEEQLDEEQLYEVFKATSMYNVKSLMGNNEALMATGRHQQQDRLSAMSDLGGQASGDDDDLDELRGFWSDGDWGKATRKARPRGVKPSSTKLPDGKRQRALQRNQRTCMITHYNRDTHAFIRRRMRIVDPDAILQLRVPPPPLPLSWGRAVKPYRPRLVQQQNLAEAVQPAAGNLARSPAVASVDTAIPAATVAPRGLLGQPHALPASRNCDAVVISSNSSSCAQAGPTAAAGAAGSAPTSAFAEDSCELHITPDIPSFDFTSLQVQQYQAILINTGWEVRPPQQQQQAALEPGVPSWSEAAAAALQSSVSSVSSRAEVVKRLAAIPLARLCPRGFIMIWVNKEHLQAVVSVMSGLGFSYVENLTWVLLHHNHSVLRLPSQFIKRSHITLYIFRKDGEGRNTELRHQRNPDVVFDCVRAVDGREWDVPAEVFSTIETLLPTGKGAFLELWAPTEAGRAGWTHIVEQAA